MKYSLAISLLLISITFFNCGNSGENTPETPKKQNEEELITPSSEKPITIKEPEKEDYWVDDSLYRWEKTFFDWVSVKPDSPKLPSGLEPPEIKNNTKPINLNWEFLLAIEYRKRFYHEFEMQIFTPVFPESLESINGKEVTLEGFVIPFDESGDFVALSANPFASCFFCGKASPASVASLYLDKKRIYNIDDFRKFRGTLRLNYDDPKDYYYILDNATPIK